MKNRMTVIDVRVMVAELQEKIVGMRCANVYDYNQKTYMFKMALPDKPKIFLLMESGIRFHTTDYAREKSDIPSGFSMKLRKHIRTKRLESVRQFGMDRVVDFQFGQGEQAFHVILELYASGNIILTDSKYEILNLLRTHKYDEDVRVAVKQVYPIAHAADDSMEKLSLGEGGELDLYTMAPSQFSEWLLSRSSQPSASTTPGDGEEGVEGKGAEEEEDSKTASKGKEGKKGGGKKGGKGGGQKSSASITGKGAAGAKRFSLKQILSSKGSGIEAFGPVLVEHCILSAGLKPSQKVSQESPLTEAEAEALLNALRDGPKLVKHLTASSSLSSTTETAPTIAETDSSTPSADSAKGFIVLAKQPEQKQQQQQKGQQKQGKKQQGKKAAASSEIGHEEEQSIETQPKEKKAEEKKEDGAETKSQQGEMLLYDDFTPVLFAQHKDSRSLSFPSFAAAVDEYFSKIETQQAEVKRAAAEKAALYKVERIRQDHQTRLNALEEAQEKLYQQARLLERLSGDVENALLVLRSALEHGVDWSELWDLVKMEQKQGNPVANLIHKLKLESKRVTLILVDEDEEGETPAVLVDVDINKTAFANARDLFSNKKNAAAKAAKTVLASEKAIKQAEKKAQLAVDEQQMKKTIQLVRKTYWFEKFHWFITSENYLVVSGRDAQQNELLVKRYMRPGDAYVHADLHGASTCVVRNIESDAPISVLALEEAGAFAVCRSAAWTAHMVTNAWWVYPHQVSKTAPTGEYLTTGSFMIRGKKNYLSGVKLEMGLALLFKVDESCIAKHLLERQRKDAASIGGDDLESLVSTSHSVSRWSVDEQANAGEEEVNEDEDEDITAQSAEEEASSLADNVESVLKLESVEDDAGDDAGEDTHEGGTNHSDDQEGSEDGQEEEKHVAVDGQAQSRESGDDEEEEENERDQTEDTAGDIRRRVTARERRLMKKGMSLEAARQLIAEEATKKGSQGGEDHEEGRHKEEEEGGNAKGRGNKASAPVEIDFSKRGKKGKLKKLKKYADQDEEERLLAMEALGNPLKQKKNKQSQQKGSSRSGKDSSYPPTHGANKKQGKPHERAEVPAEGSAAPDTKAAETEISSTPHPEHLQRKTRAEKRQAVQKEQEEVKQILEEEQIIELPEGTKVDIMHSFTGLPQAEDLLQFAVPVCAPYFVLRNYKYVVKLLPASGGKKGKLSRQIIELFVKACTSASAPSGQGAAGNEKDLIRSISDNEMVATMIGNCKIMAPGLQSLKSQQKKQQKQKAKGKSK